MNSTKANLEHKLTIDDSYLSLMNKLTPEKWHEKLLTDLESVSYGTVFLRPPNSPKLFSFYKDLRAWVYAKSIDFHYTIKLHDKLDRDTLFTILGENNIDGSYKDGFRYKFA